MLLALLALAAPLPAFAISDQALKPMSADPGPGGAVGLRIARLLRRAHRQRRLQARRLLQPAARTPTATAATVTRADGSVDRLGDVGPGGASIWVPYVGAGTYSVKITAYGRADAADDADGHGARDRDRRLDGASRPGRRPRSARRSTGRGRGPGRGGSATVDTTVSGRTTDPTAQQNTDADGAATSQARAPRRPPRPARPTPGARLRTRPPRRTRRRAPGPRPGQPRRGRRRDPGRAGAGPVPAGPGRATRLRSAAQPSAAASSARLLIRSPAQR